jgi:hypothetical protein
MTGQSTSQWKKKKKKIDIIITTLDKDTQRTLQQEGSQQPLRRPRVWSVVLLELEQKKVEDRRPKRKMRMISFITTTTE